MGYNVSHFFFDEGSLTILSLCPVAGKRPSLAFFLPML
jgi:hypothetical protein